MDAFGINWLGLIKQLAICVVVPLFIILVSFFVRVKRTSKFLANAIGVLTAWITIFPIAFFVIWVSIFVFSFVHPSQGFETAFTFYDLIAPLGTGTIFLTVLLMAFYIAHAKNSLLLSDNDRKYYQAGFLFLPFIIMPMYYLKFVKNETAASKKE
jgi:hypothetical protein